MSSKQWNRLKIRHHKDVTGDSVVSDVTGDSVVSDVISLHKHCWAAPVYQNYRFCAHFWFCCGLLQLLRVGRCVGDVVSSETLHSPTCPCKSSWKRHFWDSCWSRSRATSQQHLGDEQRHERMAVIFTEDAGKSCQRQFVRWLMSESPFKNITDSELIQNLLAHKTKTS